MTEKKRGPKPKPEHKKKKIVSFAISPLAYKRLIEIPSSERSRRVSKFLERIDSTKDAREPGERLADDDDK